MRARRTINRPIASAPSAMAPTTSIMFWRIDRFATDGINIDSPSANRIAVTVTARNTGHPDRWMNHSRQSPVARIGITDTPEA